MRYIFITTFMAAAIGGIFFAQRKTSAVTPVTVKSPSAIQVALKSTGSEPDIVSVPLGGHIQFNTADNSIHNLAQGVGDAFAENHDHIKSSIVSGTFGPDQAWRVQFNQAGTFHFHDHNHPKIVTTVVVYEKRM